MLEVLAFVGIAVAIFAAAILLYAAAKPSAFRIARTLPVAASPESIFPLIADLHRFPSWSPYEARDPNMKRTFSGALAGEGAIYEWEGNRNVGKGLLKIEHVSQPSKITMLLHMLKPFEARNTVNFMLVPQGSSTAVTWAMEGHSPFLAKVIHVFLSMDRMVGKDFEAGLLNLKVLAEAS